MRFEFATAGRIVLGRGCIRQLPALAQGLGSKALLVLGRSGRGGDELARGLGQASLGCLVFNVDGEPTTHLVNRAAALAKAAGCDLVIAVGGGSVIDAGKAAAVMLTNPGDVLDYLEVVGGGKTLARPGVPFIAAPTTAGTGAEATRNAVLGVPEHAVKASLRGHSLLPRLALIDPALSDSLPPDVTAYTGMDALVQLIEALVSNASNPLTDGLCREGLQRAGRSLAAAYHDGTNRAAREEMCVAALFSGIALANAKLGAVHGLAGVLGGVTGHPHGALCARLLPFVMEANIKALQAHSTGPNTLERYEEIARILTAKSAAKSQDGVEWVHGLCAELKIPSLAVAGLTAESFPPVIPAAQRASSMQGNPVKLSDQELERILTMAIG
jgi:alcohol dehydrogenase class IV